MLRRETTLRNNDLRLVPLLALIAVAACDSNSTAPVPPAERMVPDAVAAAPPASVSPPGFGAPKRLCGVLQDYGLETRGWKADELGARCSSDYRDIGRAGENGLATNLAYYVEGTALQRASLVKLVLNVNNRTSRGAGLEALADAAAAFFEGTSFEEPPALRDSILGAKTFTDETDAAVARFSTEQARITTYRLEVEDPAVVSRRKSLTAGSATLFQRCKEAIARDLSYGQRVSGDGEPIEEPGYLSFMVEGSGRDLFFCEVYPDGRYRIKGAYDGQYPFRQLASGELDMP